LTILSWVVPYKYMGILTKDGIGKPIGNAAAAYLIHKEFDA
jgi:hypothetical protein